MDHRDFFRGVRAGGSRMPFVLVIIGLLGGLQIYFFGVADRAQKSVAAQVLLSRSAKNVNQEVYLEQLLAVQVQELMRRESITALDLEKGVSSIVNATNPANPEIDQASPLFKPTTAATNAAKQLTEFREMLIGDHRYRVKAYSSSLPRDPTGYVDLAVCPVKEPGTEEVDTRNPKKVRVRLSVKAGFLNAVTGNTLYNVLYPGEVYGNVAEFGERTWSNQWMSTRVYGNWLGAQRLNEPSTLPGSWPYGEDDGSEIFGYGHANFYTKNDGPGRELWTMSIAEMQADPYFQPEAFDGTTINIKRFQPWETWRWWGYALNGTQGHYDGPEIPWNPNTRSRSLPKFNPDMARLLARGKLTIEKVGAMKWIPYGSDWATGPQILNEIGPDTETGLSVVDGNLVIDGRDAAFRICGRIFVSGDIVVMGKYSSKNENGEPCPAALIAGRNIYVADNLVANDRADIFDRRVKANVEKLAQISKPEVAREIAEEIWDKDQLVLLATNNLIMGNPFPFESKFVPIGGKTFIEPSIANETAVIAGPEGLRKYENEIYIHRATGVLAQPNLVGGERCFTLPWENVETACRSRDGDGRFVSNSRFMPVDLPSHAWLEGLDDVLDAYKINSNFLIHEGYWRLFLPMNITNRETGEMKPWISEIEFQDLVFNPADHAKYVQPDACGRRGVLLSTQFPYRDTSVIKSPRKYYDGFVSEMSRDVLLDEIDKVTGFVTKYGDYETLHAELHEVPASGGAAVPGPKMKVLPMLQKSIDLCLQRAKLQEYPANTFHNFPNLASLANSVTSADMKPEDAACNAPNGVAYQGGTYRVQPFWKEIGDHSEPALTSENASLLSTQGQRFTPLHAIHGDTYPEAYLHLRCYIGIYVGKDTASCSGEDPEKFAFSTDINYWEGPGYIQPETDGGPLCLEAYDGSYPFVNYLAKPSCIRRLLKIPYMQASGASCVPSGKYMYFLNNAHAGLTPGNFNVWGPDLMIKITSDDGGQPWLDIDSRFLDGKVTTGGLDRERVLKNRVKEVDGFMFSNQFIAHVGETVHDRQVQINGGISGRDFFGRLTSRIGPYRPGYDADASKAFRTWYAGKIEPGVVVVWDPRFRYSEDIMQSDVGLSELTENSAEVTGICKEPVE